MNAFEILSCQCMSFLLLKSIVLVLDSAHLVTRVCNHVICSWFVLALVSEG